MSRGLIEGGSSGSGSSRSPTARCSCAASLSAARQRRCPAPTPPASRLYGRARGVLARDRAVHRRCRRGRRRRAQPPPRLGQRSPRERGSGHRAQRARHAGARPRSERSIDYAGDVDVFRFFVSAPAVVTAYTTGSIDTVGTLLDAAAWRSRRTTTRRRGNLNTGITRMLAAGHVLPPRGALGTHRHRAVHASRCAPTTSDPANYTALWWNAAESGWGVNVNHQGNTLFATLFTYDTDGTPDVARDVATACARPTALTAATLLSHHGAGFNAQPWGAIATSTVGTMRIAFNGHEHGHAHLHVQRRARSRRASRARCSPTLPDVHVVALRPHATPSTTRTCGGTRRSRAGASTSRTRATRSSRRSSPTAPTARPCWFVMSDGARAGATARLQRHALPHARAGVQRHPVGRGHRRRQVGTMSLNFSQRQRRPRSPTR